MYAREAAQILYDKYMTPHYLLAYIDTASEELDNAIQIGRIGTNEYKNVILRLESFIYELPTDKEEYYSSVINYYRLTHHYERLELELAEDIARVLTRTVIASPESYGENDLAGRILGVCALLIKSVEGYTSARRAYEEYQINRPYSETLKVGILSHTACINLCANPVKAIDSVSELITYVEKNDLRERFPLFHEYGDIAMASIFAGLYEKALNLSEHSNKVARANGIWLQQGRAENFIACSLWALDKPLDSVIYHLEKSCFMLEKANEGHYLWRSRLNLCSVYIEAENNTVNKRNLVLALARATAKQLLIAPNRFNDILAREDKDYRRYAALMQLYRVFWELGEKKECEDMLRLFAGYPFEQHARSYCLDELSVNEAFDSVIHKGRIWSLG
jgi:hypothetical protein